MLQFQFFAATFCVSSVGLRVLAARRQRLARRRLVIDVFVARSCRATLLRIYNAPTRTRLTHARSLTSSRYLRLAWRHNALHACIRVRIGVVSFVRVLGARGAAARRRHSARRQHELARIDGHLHDDELGRSRDQHMTCRFGAVARLVDANQSVSKLEHVVAQRNDDKLCGDRDHRTIAHHTPSQARHLRVLRALFDVVGDDRHVLEVERRVDLVHHVQL
jgi:hypothetical protein